MKISTSDLNNTIWQSEKDYSKRSMNYYEYVDGQLTWVFDDSDDCEVYQYYLSEIIPTRFDSSKVGKSTEGNYLVIYDSARHTFSSFYIQKAAKLILKPTTSASTSGFTFKGGTFKKVTRHEIEQRNKINTSKPGAKNKPVKPIR